ncbi:hypothetical protein [Haloarcula onubensis]|uniref:Uncharacterized protein n=1 Tax=Haloarcula onubensis TaxID=2950539 RepID=A0ABU2FSX0_9EURY|nr:hypothetical protein [Halomicroarcula sp. S3CR25-11]MDS0283382.1 hypothetical protein [Halomicroarcula sp. S3CR25-11]
MSLVQLTLAALFATIAAGVAAVDASRRGRSWLTPAVAVGAVAFVASLGVVAADALLLSAYATLNGQPLVVSTPRELLGLTVAAVAAVSGAVCSGYGSLVRFRHAT